MPARPDFLDELKHRAKSILSDAGLISPDIKLIGEPQQTRLETVEITWGQLATTAELVGLIEIIENDAEQAAADGVIDMTDIGQIIGRYGSEVGPKVIISAATNIHTGRIFCDRLRKNLPKLVPSDRTTGEKDDFNQIDLILLSERWLIPLMLVRLGGDPRFGHFTLALKKPEKTDSGEWRVLIYDPMANGERWADLPEDWKTSYSQLAVLSNGVVDSEGEYNLTVEGDEEVAENFEIIRAKMARFQFDIYNCGPMCLYAAALRLAFRSDWNGFKFSGRDIFKGDTQTTNANGETVPGIGIYTREEIFNK